jgi:antitoxin ParD1/3/4
LAEVINLRLSGPLKTFVEDRSGENGLYDSADEYLRDLVRRDYEAEESRRWTRLHGELEAGTKAPECDFVPLDMASVIAEAKATRGLSA